MTVDGHKTMLQDQLDRLEQEQYELIAHERQLQMQYDQLTRSKVYYLHSAQQEGRLLQFVVAYAKKFFSKHFKNLYKKYIPLSIQKTMKRVVRFWQYSRLQQLRFKQQMTTSSTNVSNLPSVKQKVSVVIPTFNAGDLFDVVLRKIRAQTNLTELEIVVIDSGSTDRTVEIALQYDAEVISIPSNEFSHSATRNKGAAAATGSYVLFTVQDAVLLQQTTIAQMITFLEEHTLAAVSGRQFPRGDADAFSSWQLEVFNTLISPDKKNIIVSSDPRKFNSLSIEQRRMLCTIDDVCSLYKKDVFQKNGGYDESLEYGEDLEMGQRLITSGQKLGYMATTGVIHSHTRPADHFVKRFFTDTLFLHTVFDHNPNTPLDSLSPEDMWKSLLFVGKFLAENIDDQQSTTTIPTSAFQTKEYLFQTKNNALSSLTLLEKQAQALKLSSGTVNKAAAQHLWQHYQSVVTQAWPFFVSFIGSDMTDDHRHQLTDKLFALVSGSNLALFVKNAQLSSKQRQQIISRLTAGI